MAKIVVSLICGLIFGLGLVVAQMTNPAKILNFLDFTGAWDPSLAFVMGGALATTAIGFRLAWRSKGPLLDDSFQLPQKTRVDMRLVGGAALFEIGWGLVGLCPGPAPHCAEFRRMGARAFRSGDGDGNDSLRPPRRLASEIAWFRC